MRKPHSSFKLQEAGSAVNSWKLPAMGSFRSIALVSPATGHREPVSGSGFISGMYCMSSLILQPGICLFTSGVLLPDSQLLWLDSLLYEWHQLPPPACRFV